MDIRIGAVQEADVVYSGTGHKHTGGTDGNTLGLDAIKVDEQSADNAGVVNVTAAFVAISTLASMTVAVGDRIIISAEAQLDKGLTAGETYLKVVKSAGTASIIFGDDDVYAQAGAYVAINDAEHICLTTMAKITVAGTVTLQLQGSSLGSDSSIAAGAGDIYALVLRGIG